MHLLVNAAISADGKLASRTREQLTISSPDDLDRVERIRAESDAVMVGIGTVISDDPSLTISDSQFIQQREARGAPSQPSRIVVDSRARTPADARVMNADAETVLLVSHRAPEPELSALRKRGVSIIQAGEDRVDLSVAVPRLTDHGIGQVLVEGGGELIFSVIKESLVDELSIFIGSMIIGGRDAPTLVDGDGFEDSFPSMTLTTAERFETGVLLHYKFG